MTAVRILELAGDRPELHAEFVELDRLESALVANRDGPRFRLLELTAAGGQLDWPGITRMRHKALDLLTSYLQHVKIGNAKVFCLDVSGFPRALPGAALEEIRSHALNAEPIMVLDLQLPQDESREAWAALLSKWEKVLDGNEDSTRRRRIERPPPVPEGAAAAAKDALSTLLADPELYWDSATVGRAITRTPEHANPKMASSRARRRSQIFGVWDGNAYRYPRFQFQRNGLPHPDLPALIDVLPRDADGSGRDAALWLATPDAALGDRTPAEVFPDEPFRVIALARRRRDGDDAVD